MPGVRGALRYGRFGVGEYWVVELLDRILMIWRHEGEGFGVPEILALEGQDSSQVAGLQLDLDRLANVLEVV